MQYGIINYRLIQEGKSVVMNMSVAYLIDNIIIINALIIAIAMVSAGCRADKFSKVGC